MTINPWLIGWLQVRGCPGTITSVKLHVYSFNYVYLAWYDP